MSRCVVHGARAAVGGQITRERRRDLETDRETEEEKKAMVSRCLPYPAYYLLAFATVDRMKAYYTHSI